MNCLEFRRTFLADPRTADADAIAHRRECPACAQFAARQEQFEGRLAQALQVDVPADLNAHVLLRQTTRDFHRRRLIGIAASALLVLGITIGVVRWETEPALDRSVIAHILGEAEKLNVRGSVPAEKLAGVLGPLGMEARGNIGQVYYAGLCPMRRHEGAHLIVAGERGPVTVLIMPKEYIDRREAVRNERFSGVIVPVENGSIAVVGEQGESTDAIAARVRANLSVVF